MITQKGHAEYAFLSQIRADDEVGLTRNACTVDLTGNRNLANSNGFYRCSSSVAEDLIRLLQLWVALYFIINFVYNSFIYSRFKSSYITIIFF